MSTRQLDRAFNPQSLALVGATDRAGSAGRRGARQYCFGRISAACFMSSIRAIAEIAGRTCFTELRDLPEPPDLAIVVAPKENVEEIVQDAADFRSRPPSS